MRGREEFLLGRFGGGGSAMSGKNHWHLSINVSVSLRVMAVSVTMPL